MIRIRNSVRNIVVSIIGISLLGGCNVIGVVADKVAGDRPVAPLIAMDKLQPLVVIAENYRDPTNDGSDAARIQQIVTDRLTARQVAPVIPADRIMAVRDRNPTAFRKMSVIEIAKAVGASQVIYVDLAGIGVGTQIGSDTLKGLASANVRLIDVGAGSVIYPKDNDLGLPIGYESPLRRGSADVTAERVRSETLLGLSEKIARLFHSYRPSEVELVTDDK